MVAVADNGPDKKRVSTGSRRWRRARQVVQVLALLLFFYLLLGTRQAGTTALPHDIFFRLDPLVGISTMLASRQWVPALAVGGVTLLLTLVLGRFWCGWLCPLGTILDWTPARRPHRRRSDTAGHWKYVKYLVLSITLLSAALGSLTILVLDPITLLFRTVSNALLPAFSTVVTTVEGWLYRMEPLQAAVEWLDGLVRGWLLTEQAFFIPGLLLIAVLAGVLALNAIRRRFWCRYICPLGALLGLFSRFAWLRHFVDEGKCTSCRRCALSCPMGAIDPERGFAASAAECTMCLDCAEACPAGVIAFRGQKVHHAIPHFQPSRRQLFASLGVVAIGTALLKTTTLFRSKNPMLVRPPGVQEEELLSKCVRCGECTRVCPTGGLQPSLTTAGWEGLWTPVLVSRFGYCDYSCNSCGQVCPTGAIPRLPLDVKRLAVIGLAVIDEERCLPYAEGKPCIVCEEMCPVPEKAIQLDEESVVNEHGETVILQYPRVIRHLCIGCGICEYQCPLEGEAAIRVYAPGEAPPHEQPQQRRRGQQ